MKIAAAGFTLLLATMPVVAEKQMIVPKGSPTGFPFTPGILVDGTLYVSGQIGMDPKTGKVPAEFEAEVRAALESVGTILREAKMDYSDVVSVQVYLTDMSLFQRMNSVYTKYFNKVLPTRTTVAISKLALPEAHFEITVTARR